MPFPPSVQAVWTRTCTAASGQPMISAEPRTVPFMVGWRKIVANLALYALSALLSCFTILLYLIGKNFIFRFHLSIYIFYLSTFLVNMNNSNLINNLAING